MKVKWVVFSVLAAFFVSSANPIRQAVAAGLNTRDIDTVRNKTVLDNKDLFVIDNFLAEAIRELVKTRDFTSIAALRGEILRRRSPQPQYTEQFSESALKYITSALEETSRFPEDRRIKVAVNLLILIDGMEDLRLADLAIARLKDKNTIIRYWAVHCLTNPAIAKRLNAGGTANAKIARLFADRLKEIVDISNPDTLALTANFAGDINISQAEELLLQIADSRTKKYAGWTVEYELLDGTILKLLEGKISSAPGGSGKSAVRFAQLYSFTIQRYVKGSGAASGGLTETQKQQLASVLVETEDKCIGKLLGRPQTTIKKAVERNDYAAILKEHNRLLGDATKAGELVSKLNFDYGTASDGRKRTSPLSLPAPPPPRIPGGPKK
jgi:hypothetical protein